MRAHIQLCGKNVIDNEYRSQNLIAYTAYITFAITECCCRNLSMFCHLIPIRVFPSGTGIPVAISQARPVECSGGGGRRTPAGLHGPHFPNVDHACSAEVCILLKAVIRHLHNLV